jgi:outer membrane protein, heavy metal efflux system
VLMLALCLASLWSPAQQNPMTLDQVLARARQRAPQILSALDRIDEARGRLNGASLLFQENPTVDLSVGPRLSTSGNTTDLEVSVGQSFELGGRRSARISGAHAGVDREIATSRDVVRRLLHDVSIGFAKSLAAKERLRLAQVSSAIAGELFESMNRRYQAGDVPILNVNLARSGAARSRAEVRAAQAAYSSAIGDLRVLLGMTADEPFEVAGDLHDHRRFDLLQLLKRAGDRPDLHALEAERKQAQADVQLANGFRWPNVAPAFSYKRDQGDAVVQGGVSFTLPVFSRGQELQAVGQARGRRVDRELDATKRAVAVEVHTAYDVYNYQIGAVEELERDALPSLDENETLARRSFEEGEIGLAELLLIRRDAFETRAVYLERLLEAAIAAVELEFRAGVLQ